MREAISAQIEEAEAELERLRVAIDRAIDELDFTLDRTIGTRPQRALEILREASRV